MNTQTHLQFPTHAIENHLEGMETLSINKVSFTNQNKLLYDLLMSGKRLTFYDALVNYGISDLRRRAKDLTDIMKFYLTKEFIAGTRTKVWYMTEGQIRINKEIERKILT